MPLNRREFLNRTVGLASAALLGRSASPAAASMGATGSSYRIPATAKHLIYLFQMGAPSQPDLFDWKPELVRRAGTELPASVRRQLQFTSMSREQARFPVLPSIAKFSQRGQSGAWVSDLLPCTAGVVDRLCFIKTVCIDDVIVNHVPALNFCLTGSRLGDRPSLGAWLTYGLGRRNDSLPAFCVMISKGSGRPVDLPAFNTFFGNGFLPSEYQGVKFLPTGTPIPYLDNPGGVDRKSRRQLLADLEAMNRLTLARTGDPETAARIKQYELAHRMQSSIPELTDLSREPDSTFKLYGEDARRPGSYAHNCLIARRLVERDAICVQLMHMGWDQHQRLSKELPAQCRDTDRASAALVTDLAQRGLLDKTLVVWAGEFGRTTFIQGTPDDVRTGEFGRDHHPRCSTLWLAGGGVRPGISHGETDDYGFNVAKDPVHLHDLNATILHCMGIDHLRLTHRYQGRDFRLTDLFGKVVKKILL